MGKKISQDRLEEIKQEIRISEKFNHDVLLPRIKMSIERYVGEYIPDWAGDWDLLLNEVFPVIQYNLPAIFFRNPHAYLKPRQKTFIKKTVDPITGEKVRVEADSSKAAKTQEDILNYFIDQIKYKPEALKTLTDGLLFPYGIMWHGYKGKFGMTDEQSIYIKRESIYAQRLSPMRFLYDPYVSVNETEKGNWMGRAIDIRFRDLIEDNSLNVELNKVKGYRAATRIGQSFLEGMDYIPADNRSMLQKVAGKFKNNGGTQFVRIYEVFVRPTKKEEREGSKGWILLLSLEQDSALRQSDWVIEAEGFPGKVLSFNDVPDYKFGLSDVDVYGSIADQKNAIVNLQIRNAEQLTKSYTIINKSGIDEEDLTKIENGQNSIILYNGEKSPSQMMDIRSANPGSSSELYLIDQRIQKNLEDKSGVTDLNRGFLQSGEESATSVRLRSAGGAARPQFRQDRMREFLTESFTYLNQLNKQFLTYTDAVRIIGSLDLEWSEEPDVEDLQMETDVEIDAVSMLPESPEVELARYQQILNLVIQGINDPGIINKLRQENKTFELTPIVEQILMRARIRNPNVFRTIRPEESQGYVSVAEIRAAEANVNAILQRQEIPSPPAEGQDHMARIEVYKAAAIVAAGSGNEQVAQLLQQLIEFQANLMQEEMKKQPQPGRIVS